MAMLIWRIGILLSYLFTSSAIVTSSSLETTQSPFADERRPIKQMHRGRRPKHMFPEDRYDRWMPPRRRQNHDLGSHRLRSQAYPSSEHVAATPVSPFVDGARNVQSPRQKRVSRGMFLEHLKGLPDKPPSLYHGVSGVDKR